MSFFFSSIQSLNELHRGLGEDTKYAFEHLIYPIE